MLAIFGAIFTTTSIYSPTPVHADSFSCRYFLGLISWDCHLSNFDGEDTLKSNILIIASNVFVDITVVAAYLVLGYVIYGGYLYIFSSGDPGKVAASKKTLTHAFIGLAIVMLSSVILNAIRFALIQGATLNCAPGSSGCPTNIEPEEVISNIVGWVIGISGVVATVFAIMGGIGYITSSGDPAKLKKAKDTIIYALIGLAIVALAQIITAFISNMIRDAKKTSHSNEIIIAKEYHEN